MRPGSWRASSAHQHDPFGPGTRPRRRATTWIRAPGAAKLHRVRPLPWSLHGEDAAIGPSRAMTTSLRPSLGALALVAAVGCGAGSPPSGRPAEPVAAAPARLLPAPEVAVRQARIALGHDDALELWIDIVIDGAAPRADSLCRWLVAEQLRLQQVRPAARIAQPCGATALPAVVARADSHLLVTPHDFSEDNLAMALAADRVQAPSPTGTPATGTATRYHRFADRAACERARDALVQARARAAAEAAQREESFLTMELHAARADAQQACDEARDCTARPASGHATCTALAESPRQRCELARARASSLATRLTSARSPAAHPPPSCRPE